MSIGIVTGASSGMGKWFALYAKSFFPDIDELWLLGRNMNRLRKVATNIKCASRVYSLDLTNDNDIVYLKDEIEKELPNIALLVNCAGVGVIGDNKTLTNDDCSSMIRLNCESLTRVTHICLPYMDINSHIINIASSAAFVPQAGFGVYAATKSYVLSYSDALYKELKKEKVYVTAVCPGAVKTPFFKNAEKYQSIKSFKKIFMAKDKNVVLLALWDAKKNKMHSIYGISMKLFYIACKFLPLKFLMLFM